MIAILLLLVSQAWAGELRVVRDGDTVESIATELGDPDLADTIRRDNGLAVGGQPTPGDMLTVPDRPGVRAQPAQIVALSGSGTVTASAGMAVAAAEGMFLPADAEMCTATDSFATIRLAASPGCTDEDDVTLLPGTCLTVDANQALIDERTSVVSVRTGAIAVKRNDGDGRVAVRTEAGLTTGDNGGFRVAVEESATRTEAVTGDVAVIGSGSELEVPSGFGVRTDVGSTPGDLVKLLPPSTPTAPDNRQRLLVPDFAWTPVERALGYRVELATDAEFTRLVRRVEVGRASWSPSQLFLPYLVPELHWRVVSFDRLGFEGIPSPARELRFPRGVEESRSDAEAGPN